MGKYNRNQESGERFGRCEICLELIPIEYYFHKGDVITCHECGTEYEILSKTPVRLLMQEDVYDPDFYDEMQFDE